VPRDGCHFPTKEALFEAVFVSRVERLVAMARQLSGADDAGAAFFGFFASPVSEGAANRGLADAPQLDPGS
jgi:AcrR family transcriptional regulator